MGPELCEIYKALSTAKCNDVVNLERLETLGDSFLKLTSSLYILTKYPKYNEGSATSLKGRVISNKNLFYVGRKKNIPGYLTDSDLYPDSQWLPPGFTIPDVIQNKILQRELSIRAMFYIDIPLEEQVCGIMEEESVKHIEEMDYPVEDNEEVEFSSLCGYLKYQSIGDKSVADVVEALIGAYFQSNGFLGKC